MEHQLVKTNKTGNVIVQDLIYFKIEQPNTLASYIMLKNDYMMQDETNKRSYAYRLKMIGFSRNYLNGVLKKYGKLSCTYCPKTDLIIEENGMRVPHNKKATIDHIEPTSKGGALLDPRNITVCCSKCNGKKSNTDLLTFLGY